MKAVAVFPDRKEVGFVDHAGSDDPLRSGVIVPPRL